MAEAILTEPGPASADDGGSILLEDTRGSRPEAQDGEQEGFLSGRRSESDNEEEEDESDNDVQKAKSARLGVLGNNSDARVSHLNVNGDRHSEDDYEFVGGQRSPHGDEPDQRQRGGLSAKAGIILVR